MSNKYMYLYLHDGGVYIGCKAQGRFYDCKHQDQYLVDCEQCEHNERRKDE